MNYNRYHRDYTTNEPSYYDYLSKQLQMIKKMVKRIDEYDETLKQAILDMQEKIETELQKIVDGDYLTDQYIESLEKWIDRNLTEIVARIAKIVWFGLDDEGYFIAVIPDSWDSITFDTTNDGHLMLKY